MRKSVYVIRHVQFEDLGILEKELTQQGYDITYLEAPLVNFNDYNPLDPNLLIALGAPIGAYDEKIYPFLSDEIDFITKRLDANKPILGICLGAQIMSRILGEKVAPMSHGQKEIGFAPITLTEAGENSPLKHLKNIPVLHWHGDEFGIPKGTNCLAETKLCSKQAFAKGSNILGLQFHMEADATKIESWLVGHSAELNAAHIDIPKIRQDAKKVVQKLSTAGLKAFREWLAQTSN